MSKRKSLINFIILFTSFVFCYSAQGTLNLELTRGVHAAIPIAITTTLTPHTKNGKKLSLINEVVRTDLEHSGYFQVLTANTENQEQPNAATQEQDYWQKKGADYLIHIELTPSGATNLTLTNLYTNKPVIQTHQQPTTSHSLRCLAHHLSDKIYQQLTGHSSIFTHRIAYIVVHSINGKKQYSLEVADSDGYYPHHLLISKEPIMSPAWSPDGKHLAYVSFEHHRATIYLQALATGKRKAIAAYPGLNSAPAWSPDGRSLAIVLSLSGMPKIYRLDLMNNKLTQLTHGASIDTEPVWSPNGRSLLFTSNRGGQPQIYRLQLASKKIERVTFQGDYNAHASFTHDGQRIAVLHHSDGLFSIGVKDLSKDEFSILTDIGLGDTPTISPTGDVVLYATHYGDRGVLSLISMDGQVKWRLPAQSGDVQSPAWSPNLLCQK